MSLLIRIKNSKIDDENYVPVKDVMSSPLVTVKEDACIPVVAHIMEHYNIGCVVVIGKEGKSLGIITEKDLVMRVLTNITDKRFVKKILGESAQNDKLTAKEVMTCPVIVISPDETLIEAARKMRRCNIRRLVVVSKNKSIGIITSRDILSVTPELIQVLREKQKIAEVISADFSENLAIIGYCERCGNWSSKLKESNGNFLCEECIA